MSLRQTSLTHDEPGVFPGSISTPDAKPKEMSTEELAHFVADAFAKMKTALPYIIELRSRFAELPRGKANIMGCRTWTEFCNEVLHRTDSAIRKAIAEESEEPDEDEDPIVETGEEIPDFEVTKEEEEDLRRIADRMKEKPEPDWSRLTEFFSGDSVPDKLKPTASEIVEAGYRTLAKQRHPDHGGSQEAMVMLNATVSCLRKIVK